MDKKKSIWPKSITVDKRIVKILSESTYDNFPAALKEIITNSYDADASVVNINIDIRKEIITITDNGKGMSEKEFDFFTRIAGVKREKEGGITASGRHIVGKFGVGFLSIFPFFKNYSIESTKKGIDEILHADIPSHRYFASGELVEVNEIPIQGGIRYDKSKTKESFTTITLKGFTPIAKAFFFPTTKKSKTSRTSIKSYSSLDKLIWRLEEDLPIRYKDDRFNKLTTIYSPNLSFEVFLNGEKLYRRVYAKEILEINGREKKYNRVYENKSLQVYDENPMQIGKIKFHYFILSDKIAVEPIEGRALKIRNINTGVGLRDAFGLGSELKGGRSRLQQLTGEVLIIEGLNDLISVSRDTFYYDEDYEQLQDFLVLQLSKHSTQLEKEAAYKNEESSTKIKNIKYIEEELSDDKEEEAVLFKEETKQQYPRKANKTQPKVSKSIEVAGDYYSAKISNWNYRNDSYPACKIEGDKVLINKSYPLFKGVKYTDIFIKMHLLILKNLIDKNIDKRTYNKLVSDILEYYNEYT